MLTQPMGNGMAVGSPPLRTGPGCYPDDDTTRDNDPAPAPSPNATNDAGAPTLRGPYDLGKIPAYVVGGLAVVTGGVGAMYRSLIPAEGGASGVDSSLPEGDDAATLDSATMLEDSAPTPDACMPSRDGGDAAVVLDGSAEAEGAAGDGSPDRTSSADASPGDADDARGVD